MSDDLVKRLRDPSLGSPRWMDTMEEAAAEITRLRAELAAARRDGMVEAAQTVRALWLKFREKDDGSSNWIFKTYDDIPTGDDFEAAIRAAAGEGK